ncbi:MAG: hypothetical protein AB4290_28825 [Spirulina sp.]
MYKKLVAAVLSIADLGAMVGEMVAVSSIPGNRSRDRSSHRPVNRYLPRPKK